jgi:hypothetical protein
MSAGQSDEWEANAKWLVWHRAEWAGDELYQFRLSPFLKKRPFLNGKRGTREFPFAASFVFDPSIVTSWSPSDRGKYMITGQPDGFARRRLPNFVKQGNSCVRTTPGLSL